MRKISTKILVLGSFLLAIALIMSCQSQSGSSDDTAMAVKKVATGEELYISYCQICHGVNGDGPMTEVLTVPPSDLTQIAARRNGNFPRDEMRTIIDGRVLLKGHGSREMPIWGATFMASEDLQTEEEVTATIDRLIDYLEGIQKS